MDCYYIDVARPETFCATRKPLADVCEILRRDGLKTIMIPRQASPQRIVNILNLAYAFAYALLRLPWIRPGSILLLQHPRGFFSRPAGFRLLKAFVSVKRLKLLTIVHDVDDMRCSNRFEKIGETSVLNQIANLSFALIVHNGKMKELFANRGMSEERIVCLECFDYLTDCRPGETLEGHHRFSVSRPSVAIAGNLDADKAEYLRMIQKVGDVQWHLFGPNFDWESVCGVNIHYHGVVPPEELPTQLVGDFGLVWDGTSIDTCTGQFGEYLRINNPHKLSLYLASGLPVIVWQESAICDFVQQEQVGIGVSSLCEIPQKLAALPIAQYNALRENAVKVGQRLRDGFYTRRAFAEALKRIYCDGQN